MGSLVKSLLRRLESTDKHVSDIRSDYANFESENSHSLKEAKRDIEEKSKALAELEAEGQALQAKNAKLRDNNERLQATIDEHRQVNEDLQNKLKQENKINQGTYFSSYPTVHPVNFDSVLENCMMNLKTIHVHGNETAPSNTFDILQSSTFFKLLQFGVLHG